MTMLQLAGPPAATAFRLEKLRAELRALAPAVGDAAAHFEHFVHLERPLTEREDRVLRALLDYGGGAAPRSGGAQKLYVVPRLGTISPWSSKASDIARNCGFAGVRRIERGVAFYLDSKNSGLAALLHDRMTQTVLRSFDEAAKLFEHVPPRPLQFIADIQKANRDLGLALSKDEI